MIKQEIELEKERWHITAYYAVTHYEVDEIMQALQRAGCYGKNLERAYENLSSGNMNTGLCFTGDGESVLVVSVTSSGGELANSLVHELHHLASQIGRELGYDLMGEDVCYLAGGIAKEMYNVVGKYLCSDCRSDGKYRRLY